MKENVGKLVKRPRVHEPAISIPPAREVLHMLDQLSNISLAWPSRDTAIIAMLYICLLLPSELISLNVQDFDWGKNEIIVSGRRDRRVPMLSGVRTAIETYLAERKALVSAAQARGYDTSAFIIGQTLNGILGRHGRARLLVRQINLIVEGAMEHFPHLSYATPTTLRKAGAVHMLDNGADIRSVAKLMGVELRAVERLSRLSTTKKREEVDRTHPRGR